MKSASKRGLVQAPPPVAECPEKARQKPAPHPRTRPTEATRYDEPLRLHRIHPYGAGDRVPEPTMDAGCEARSAGREDDLELSGVLADDVSVPGPNHGGGLNVDLRTELRESLKRRQMDVPKKPYHRKRLYPNSGRYTPPAIDTVAGDSRSKRKATCEGCGKPVKTRQPEGEPAYCRPCWLKAIQ